MIPKIFHQTTPTNKLSWEEGRLLSRNTRILSGWEYRHWNDAANDKIIKDYFPEHWPAFRSIRRGVIKADISRYAYMHVFGGLYLDTDYKLYRALEPQILETPCLLPVEIGPTSEQPDRFKIGNAILASAPGHPFWSEFIAHILSQNVSAVAEDTVVATSGPRGLTNFFLANKSRFDPIISTPRSEHFYPQLQFAHHLRQPKEAYGIHLCWGSWRSQTPISACRNFARRKITALR